MKHATRSSLLLLAIATLGCGGTVAVSPQSDAAAPTPDSTPSLHRPAHRSPQLRHLWHGLRRPRELRKGRVRRQLQLRDNPVQRLLRRHRYRYVPLGSEFNPECQSPLECSQAQCKDTWHCKPEKLGQVDLYLMSECPYGTKAVGFLEEALKDLGDVNLHLHYIGSGTAATAFKSMNGDAEVREDLRAVCAIRHYEQKHLYLRYIGCRSLNVLNPDWVACTGASTGIDASVIRRCSEGPEGAKLLEASFKSSEVAGIGASPTFVINNKFKKGGATDAATVKRFICAHNPNLKGCANVPAPVSSGP